MLNFTLFTVCFCLKLSHIFSITYVSQQTKVILEKVLIVLTDDVSDVSEVSIDSVVFEVSEAPEVAEESEVS